MLTRLEVLLVLHLSHDFLHFVDRLGELMNDQFKMVSGFIADTRQAFGYVLRITI